MTGLSNLKTNSKNIRVEIKDEVKEICDLATAAIQKSNANSDIAVEIKQEVKETCDLATAAIPKSNDPTFHSLWQDGEKLIQGLNYNFTLRRLLVALLDFRNALNFYRIIKFEIKFEKYRVEIKDEVKEICDLATAAIQKSNANSDIANDIYRKLRKHVI